MIKLSKCEQFAENLYRENLRAFLELESMRYGIMARLGFSEADALELAVAIVAVDRQASQAPRATVEVGIGEVMTAAGGRVSAG
ncbi:hypothetical protein FBQ81_04095 [Chloroflexi bacterium CFX6]|nr:hypothetical protein [Chloroflexi bacterium CFX6]